MRARKMFNLYSISVAVVTLVPLYKYTSYIHLTEKLR